MTVAKRPLKSRTNRAHTPLPDYLAPDLNLLFVGINPGIISAAAGHYYANPRNSFWRLLHEAGLTRAQLRPEEDHRMPQLGYGLTDIVKRPSHGAGDLKTREFIANRHRLLEIVERYKPRAVCFNSKTAFEGFFGKGTLRTFGPQAVTLADTSVFVLPSTSPANAAVPLVVKRKYFKALKRWLEKSS
ncbi:MAG: mismatch-specific DNA-glycosylase [Deltaproteobacteria bacterium]|nr:MAG: mismatch-specific DNA-glycosylase [Deltaproteobacteria bacterium]